MPESNRRGDEFFILVAVACLVLEPRRPKSPVSRWQVWGERFARYLASSISIKAFIQAERRSPRNEPSSSGKRIAQGIVEPRSQSSLPAELPDRGHRHHVDQKHNKRTAAQVDGVCLRRMLTSVLAIIDTGMQADLRQLLSDVWAKDHPAQVCSYRSKAINRPGRETYKPTIEKCQRDSTTHPLFSPEAGQKPIRSRLLVLPSNSNVASG